MDVRSFTLIILAFLWNQDLTFGVRLVELRVPTHAASEGEALLGCQFDMEGDILYSVKWYKDNREFYRYVPKNRNPVQYFFTPGVYVDMARSSSDVVTLVNLRRESAGLYRCEVSGEGPLFTTAADEKYVAIQVLPDSAPKILGLQSHYKIGDRVTANCTTSGSRPETQLKWLLNGKEVPRIYVRDPWYRVSMPSDTTETILQLRFLLKPVHFNEGVMELKCQATIAPLYQQESIFTVTSPDISTPAPPPVFQMSAAVRNEDLKDRFITALKPRRIVELPPKKDDKDDSIASALEKSWCVLMIALLMIAIL